jgi:hypothetical protein
MDNKDKILPPVSGPGFVSEKKSNGPSVNIKTLVTVVIVALVLVIGGYFAYQKFFSSSVNIVPTVSDQTSGTSDIVSSSTIGLPDNGLIGLGNDMISSDGQAVEYLNFADFYKTPDNSLAVKLSDYKLPLNVKNDVINYYDVARKLNLDSSLESLNKNGLAIMDNPFTDAKSQVKVNNFFSVYDTLSKRQVPVLITTDFITYYYQNTFKKAFQDVESNVFYSNLFYISKKMFDVSKARYEARLAEKGDVNDPILEGNRLEMAYFAVALSLLQPDAEQVGEKTDGTQFSASEVSDYTFNPPQYLKVDVLQEVKLIKEHKQTVKSPVMLYTRDYSRFIVPEDYKTNAKLNNFYLSAIWLNSVFPAYYKSDICSDCSSDFADYKIKTVAANLMAQDLFNDVSLKNGWARIYKVLSFFKGMRDELTLVNYRDAFFEVFGTGAKVEDVFGSANSEGDNNLRKFQEKILSYQFKEAYGALDKNNSAIRPSIGVKMLADFYWPSDYIFSELTAPEVSNYKSGAIKKTNVTACKLAGIYQRCIGFAMDVINLVTDVPMVGDYFMENTNYQHYGEKLTSLKDILAQSDSLWHNNNYWSTLQVVKASLGNPVSYQLPFMKNTVFSGKENIRSLATWVNLQLPVDSFGLYQTSADSLKTSGELLEYGYIEPNLPFINELLANTKMAEEMFSALNLRSEATPAVVDLRDLDSKLTVIKSIMEKELSGETLSSDDYDFINQLSREYRVDVNGSKSFKITGKNKLTLTEDISDVRLMVLVQKKGKDLIMVAGPVFKYWEKR